MLATYFLHQRKTSSTINALYVYSVHTLCSSIKVPQSIKLIFKSQCVSLLLDGIISSCLRRTARMQLELNDLKIQRRTHQTTILSL